MVTFQVTSINLQLVAATQCSSNTHFPHHRKFYWGGGGGAVTHYLSIHLTSNFICTLGIICSWTLFQQILPVISLILKPSFDSSSFSSSPFFCFFLKKNITKVFCSCSLHFLCNHSLKFPKTGL